VERKNVPQRLKPVLFYSTYGAAESRALSKQVSALSISAVSEVVLVLNLPGRNVYMEDGMKFPGAVNLHHAVIVSQQRRGNVWPRLVPHE